MSKGRIIKPKNAVVPNEVLSKPIIEIIYHAVQSCEVEVDNNEWQEADNKIRHEIKTSNDTTSQKIKNIDDKINKIETKIGSNQGNISDEIKEIKQEIENIKSRKPLDISVTINSDKSIDLGQQHKQFPLLLKILATKLNVYIVGPAGSGKTTAAMYCAKALNTKFHFTGAVASEFKLTGFIDAQGRIVSTEFRKAYENGGLFLFDEIDASYPQAVLAFNAALSNDYMDFPDKRVERHNNFYCIAAANTYGQGADRQYIGRNQLDAASLDRFVFIDWGYDENLERAITNNNDWTEYIQKIRKYIESQKIRHVVSPRASIFGSKLLANGIERETVENTVIWKGLDEVTKQKIKQYLKPNQKILAQNRGVFSPKTQINVHVNKGDILGTIETQVYNNNQFNRSVPNIQNVIAPISGIIFYISNRANIDNGDLLVEIKL